MRKPRQEKACQATGRLNCRAGSGTLPPSSPALQVTGSLLMTFSFFLQFSLWAGTFSHLSPQASWKEHWLFLSSAYLQPSNGDSFSLFKSLSEDTLWWDFSFTKQLNPGFSLESSTTPKWLWVTTLIGKEEFPLPLLPSFLALGPYPKLRHLKFWYTF